MHELRGKCLFDGHTYMNMKRFKLLFLFCLCTTFTWSQTFISGNVTDASTGEALVGVSVYQASKKMGTTTNAYGFFSLNIPENDTFYVSYLGYQTQVFVAQKQKDMLVKLTVKTDVLKEAEVKAQIQKNPPLGTQYIDLKMINSLPALGGERDLIKALQNMPGVKKGADGTVGMLVRGGSADQNLILMDEAPVYNAAHLLGFFSLFNTDAIKDATMQTGGFTANYGGRLSSVLSVTMNEGNKQKFQYSGSVGILASRLAAQGPLFKGKGSFLVAGRISYLNKMYQMIDKELPFYFYDVNAKLNYQLSKRDQIFVSMYSGDDVLEASDADSARNVKVSSRLGNHINTIRWNRRFANQKMFSNVTVFTSNYRYFIKGEMDDNVMQINANIADLGYRFQLDHHVNNKLSFKYGSEYIHHTFVPNNTKLKGNFNENIKANDATSKQLNESAIFATASYKMNARLSAVAGIRLSAAQVSGRSYINPEPRLLLNYDLTEKHALSLSYSKMVQYMFLLSGSSVMLPTDLWYGVTQKIKPQEAHIISAGYKWQTTNHTSRIETYYKPMHNLVEYKEGSVELGASNIDDVAVQGNGEAYGIEWMNTNKFGKLNLTTAYTLSWSTRKFNDLNDGKQFYARFDRRHDFNIILQYDFSKRVQFSALWSYATGSRFTPLVGQFMMPNGNFTNIDLLPIYTSRNAVKLSDSHKLDVNLVIKNKPGKKYQAEWHIGAYNVYNQTQPYRIKTQKNSDGSYSYKQMGLFGFIPSIGYQFKF